MPKPGVHTPITDEEAMEWVQRMLFRHPEPGATISARSWKEFLTKHFEVERGYGPTVEQLMTSFRGVSVRFEVLPRFGISTFQRWTPRATYLGYRDIVTGRFISKATVVSRLEAGGYKLT